MYAERRGGGAPAQHREHTIGEVRGKACSEDSGDLEEDEALSDGLRSGRSAARVCTVMTNGRTFSRVRTHGGRTWRTMYLTAEYFPCSSGAERGFGGVNVMKLEYAATSSRGIFARVVIVVGIVLGVAYIEAGTSFYISGWTLMPYDGHVRAVSRRARAAPVVLHRVHLGQASLLDTARACTGPTSKHDDINRRPPCLQSRLLDKWVSVNPAKNGQAAVGSFRQTGPGSRRDGNSVCMAQAEKLTGPDFLRDGHVSRAPSPLMPCKHTVECSTRSADRRASKNSISVQLIKRR